MDKLPLDIIINNIIPYTYSIQPKTLMEDIQNYCVIKQLLMDEKYDTKYVKHSILSIFFYNEIALKHILDRYFMKRINNENIYHFSSDKKFGILFGLFTKEERNIYLNYIVEDDWFLK
jgi:hypothetical protein